MTTEFVNYYKVLQVDPSADTDVIEAAWRKLAFKNHPDLNKTPGAEEKMKLLNMAKDILMNPERRRQYDQQFSRATQTPEPKSTSGSYEYETDEDDVWDEREVRDLALQFLSYIRQALNEKKYRIAREKLYVFDGLGTQPEGYGVLPRFDRSIPEWQEAKRLNDLANQQASSFSVGLAIVSSILYAIGGGFIGALVSYFNSYGFEEVILNGFLFGAIGFGVGIVLGLIGTIAYSMMFAGNWGYGTDMFLGLMAPLAIAFLLSIGFFILVLLVAGAFIYAASSGSKKR
ncbi:MAG: DnaJ domain-containing protein [Anaerolineales bacterium]|nr:DnaJ domain-containing protein [Anaerolineales bacterium]